MKNWKTYSCMILALGLSLTGCPDPDPDPVLTCTEVLPASIEADLTLAEGCYLAEQGLDIKKDVTLTVMPGVTVVFGQDTELAVNNGVLSAVGTEAKPIVFTGAQKTRGYWNGVAFYYAGDLGNQFDYVTVEYGGANGCNGVDSKANLCLYPGGSRLAISNSILQESTGYGMYVADDAIIPTFDANTLTGNALGAGIVSAHALGQLNDSNSFVGNDLDVLVVEPDQVVADQTWAAIDVPYLLSDETSIESHLTIAAGATLIFGQNAWLSINTNGALTAVGTTEKPIAFTGEQATRGYWNGIAFYYSDKIENQFAYVTIEYAGGEGCNGVDSKANLCLYPGGVRLAISNSTLQESEGYGMYADEDATITAFDQNLLTANTLGAAIVGAQAVGQLDDSSTFAGNDLDLLVVEHGSVSADQTWPAIDIPYRLSEDVSVEAHLTIAAGATLEFDQNAWLAINLDGALTAVGTADAPIVFTGAQKTAGYWSGIAFYYSDDLNNQLDFVTVEYGGFEGCNGADSKANICLYPGGARLDMTNSNVQHSAHCGVYVADDATVNNIEDIAAGNSFSDNANGDVCGP